MKSDSDRRVYFLTAFAEVAEQYCEFIEALRKDRPAKLYMQLEKLLHQLHGAIIAFETLQCDSSEDDDRMSHEAWTDLAKDLMKIMHPETVELFEWHQEINASSSQPQAYVQEATRAEMLWDDLADIYRDLQSGLNHWQSGTQQGREAAAWEWRCHYESHWGDHLFRAMTIVHEVRYQLHVE